ncbi:MAG TPA: glutamate synthase subunit beta [Pyrinomonadaceae bacterium]|mgnify:CR=1 FL=1|nr:glutamate synthase subunit beta [Acidobacteriota bacterium]HQZ98130.1 glutamate synthase subunit beta [Pyrinomonadaceae bacterium]
MGKITGFMEYSRTLPILGDARSRIGNWSEFHDHLPDSELQKQGARCMNCGIPFCHTGTMMNGATIGCPLHNLIPEWNDLVFSGRWREAYERLALTNNFPEFTGRVCPAPCESSCVLGINEDPVMIKEIEASIVDRAFEEGWIVPRPPVNRTGNRVAVIGSGPAGLACADELNKHGHSVTVFEREDLIGGLLMYGIPNMKLEKSIVQRRIDLLAAEGIEFRTNVSVGQDISTDELKQDFDAIVLCCGAPKPRDLNIEGRELDGIHFAMNFLTHSTKTLMADGAISPIDVKGKDVIVIGGGDTGTDCVGTSLRQGCKSLVQFEIMPRPADRTATHDGWLSTVRTFQVDYGQNEAEAVFGGDPREYSVLTKRFTGDDTGNLNGLETVAVRWDSGKLVEIIGTEKFWPVDAAFLAMGFTGGEDSSFFHDLGVETDQNNIVVVDENKQTSLSNVFAAGDCERGQSLIVWAIADGRNAAESVHAFLSQPESTATLSTHS